MYTVSNPADPRFIDYVAVLGDGREERLLLGQLFPEGGRHLRARIDAAAYAIDGATASAPAIAHLDTMLDAVAGRYRVLHATDSVASIRLWLGTVPARHFTGVSSIRRRLLHEYRPR
jgi:hypothetical protein